MRSVSMTNDERGFTLVEVMVAIVLLLGGVLATVSLVDQANSTTNSTKAREAGTALVRELVEASRAIPYSQLRRADIDARLQARSEFSDTDSGAGWVIERRGFRYTVTTDVCLIDDATDESGPHEPAAAFCSTGSAPAGTEDPNADDQKRVTVRLEWVANPGGKKNRVTQRTLVPNPAGGLGPSVILLEPTSPTKGTEPVTVTEEQEGKVEFHVVTSSPADSVAWSIDGQQVGLASARVGTDDTQWDFSWQSLLDDDDDDGDGSGECCRFYDGTYTVGAEAFDATGRSGATKTLRVKLNRFSPFAPRDLEGGYNRPDAKSAIVDLIWKRNRERDVEGYRVYRLVGGERQLVTSCADPGRDYISTTRPPGVFSPATECWDGEPKFDSGSARYVVVALDSANDEAGSLREGDDSSELLVTTADNLPPKTPIDLTSCKGGEAGCTDADGNPAPVGSTVLIWSASSDPDPSDGMLLYRIYRDGVSYGDRYGKVFDTGTETFKFVDTSTGTAEHKYWVTAVDSRYAESDVQTEPEIR